MAKGTIELKWTHGESHFGQKVEYDPCFDDLDALREELDFLGKTLVSVVEKHKWSEPVVEDAPFQEPYNPACDPAWVASRIEKMQEVNVARARVRVLEAELDSTYG